VNQVEPSELTSTRVDTVLVNIAPDVIALEPLPLLTRKNEFPKITVSIPYGFAGLLMIGALNCNVSEPPAPIDTIWLVENGGAKGVMPAPEAGAPKAALEFVKFGLKPLPGLYAITPLANCAQATNGTRNKPANTGNNSFFILIFQFVSAKEFSRRF